MESIHKFEAAGLGRAPFRCTGVSESIHQPTPDSPRQPGATCDYCFTGIMNVFHIRSADGRTFKVGCDCVEKTGDAGLKKAVAAHVRAAQKERERARIEASRAAFEAARSGLEKEWPCLVQKIAFLFHNGGHTGQLRATRIYDKHAAGNDLEARIACTEARERALWQQEAARKAAELRAQEEARRESTLKIWGFVLPILDTSPGDFCLAIAEAIRHGYPPTGRALNIVADLYAKAHGRRGSRAYAAAYDEFDRRILGEGA